MKRNKEEHARYSVYLKTFVELKKNGNRPISLRQIEQQHPKRVYQILSFMQEAMYARGGIFHGTTVGDGIGFYLKQDIAAMSNAEFIEYYKQNHDI